MARSHGCMSIQDGDQVRCGICNLQWDVDDPEPPDCRFAVRIVPEPYKQTVGEILQDASATFSERGKVYGNNYLRGGALLLALFPDGGIPAIQTEEDALRLRLIVMASQKLQRYAHAFAQGGHKDSAHDLIVYAAMLEENTK